MAIDFAPVRAARLQPADIAKLAKVSRVTASGWLNGHKQPHHLLTERVCELVDAIDQAVQAGRLPVPHHVHRRERGLYIQKAIEQQGQAASE
jgi:hypothetical protein